MFETACNSDLREKRAVKITMWERQEEGKEEWTYQENSVGTAIKYSDLTLWQQLT